jgi:signal transduction histidine kinase
MELSKEKNKIQGNMPEGKLFANRLRMEIPNILNRWEKSVREEVQAARELHPTDLKNSLPKFLENLAQALEFQEKGTSQGITVAREHGKERSTFPQYTLGQIIAEYRLLRRAIFEVLGENITSGVRDTIVDAIEIGISESASEFTKQQFQLREQFVTMLAHDIRNPLSAAKTNAQMILRSPEKKESVMNLATRIVNTIDRTDKLIQDLLDSNLVEMGQMIPLKIEECNLNTIVNSAMDEATAIYGKRFVLESENTISGFWDHVILQRAIGNLLTNAVKYGDPKTEVKITVTKKDSQVQIAIHNSGDVITEKEQLGIFDNLYRASTKRDGNAISWGIGLFLVKGAMLAHGGTVQVQSNEKEGTIFTLIFPMDSRIKKDNKKMDISSEPKLLH